jgi:hypothetical protein
MYDIPFDRSFLQLSNSIRHVMPSTDTKPELTAKTSMAQPVSQPTGYANGLKFLWQCVHEWWRTKWHWCILSLENFVVAIPVVIQLLLHTHLLSVTCAKKHLRSQYQVIQSLATYSTNNRREINVKPRPYMDSITQVKQSRNMPGVAQRVSEGLGSRISWHLAREGGESVSLTHRPPLPPGNVPVQWTVSHR